MREDEQLTAKQSHGHIFETRVQRSTAVSYDHAFSDVCDACKNFWANSPRIKRVYWWDITQYLPLASLPVRGGAMLTSPVHSLLPSYPTTPLQMKKSTLFYQ